MPAPKGTLTAAQYEIMTAVWASGGGGATIADIRATIAAARRIGRTTVLNQVDRLERRGWLARLAADGPTRFRATVEREDAAQQLVAGFVSDYFQGSTVELVSALLGQDACALTKQDIGKLRKLLESARRRSVEDQP